MADINRIHVSPGIYATNTVDMKTAANSMGVTKLAAVGETLKGPAFQPYWVHSPKEYASVFGGTSPKKFAGSNYPKYELPYIANEFLKKSTELCVVRTLGFSGYNAGPAWVITGQKGTSADAEKFVIAVLRSRGTYKYRPGIKKSDADCECTSAFDSLTFEVGEVSQVMTCNSPISYNMDAVKLDNYVSINSSADGCSSYVLNGEVVGFDASYGNLGRFTIKCIVGPSREGDVPDSEITSGVTVSIPVSLNKADKDYILNVLGTTNDDGDQPLFVESLYDVAWEDLVLQGKCDNVTAKLTTYDVAYAANYGGLDPISGILTKTEEELTAKDLGKRYLYSLEVANGSPVNVSAYTYTITYDSTPKIEECKEGCIYTVSEITENGKKKYVYRHNDELDVIHSGLSGIDFVKALDKVISKDQRTGDEKYGSIVYNYEDGLYYKNAGSAEVLRRFTIEDGVEIELSGVNGYNVAVLNGGPDLTLTVDYQVQENRNWDGTWSINGSNPIVMFKGQNDTGKIYNVVVYNTIHVGGGHTPMTVVNSKVAPVLCDMNDYKTQYRYSSTPWVVSNAKGDAKNIEVNKLFRFHTISDGAASGLEVKVSIENIRPDSGEFDVVVRAYNDNDSGVNVLERFGRCTMVPGKNFIGYQIGTIDGVYESKSNYITVEVAETTAARNSVPAGFIGYPVPVYGGGTVVESGDTKVKVAPIAYNTAYDEDVAKRKQYFGISDRTGYDNDYFTFKGKMATLEDPYFVSNGFHLDCRLGMDSYSPEAKPKVTVDGVEGYVFDTVDINARTTTLDRTPIIASENEMQGCIFEDVKLRKFTMMFAGGFDGWDIYRDKRTNTDDFSYSTYKGYINRSTGVGYGFDIMENAGSFDIDERAITSDYYSTLAGVSLLKNPEEVDINVLVTPGIDTINNTKLVNEVFSILEDRTDTFYVSTTPDKESGAGDYTDDIMTVDEAVSDFEGKELFCDYAATYYPWVKIEDAGEYVWIPATRDVVRNLAESDNTNTTMNLAPAGTTRGKVNAIKARKNLKNGEADALYEANLNPVRTYAQEGVVIMGQKTLRQEDDLMNRVDVMRMVMRMRKLIAIGCLGLIFEPNDNSTVKAFKSIINGIMQGFVDNRAIERWKMDVDESQEALDRLEISATIYVKPIRALEVIRLNFVVTNNDVYFEA